MENHSLDEHVCILPLRKKVIALKPLPPTASLWSKLSRKCYSLIILSLENVQCKKFYTHPSLMRAEMKRHVHSAYSYIIHPFSKLSSFIDKLFYILLIHRTIFIVYAEKKPSGIFASCLVRDAIHIIIMITRFFTGYVDTKSREICIEQSKILKNYLKSHFILDVYLAVEEYTYLSGIELLKIVTNIVNFFVYMIKFKILQHVLNDAMDSLSLNKHFTFVLYNTLLLTFILHGFASLIYWVPTHIYRYRQSLSKKSWIVSKDLTYTEYNFSSYIASILIVTSYFVGSSHFDYVSEPIEQLLLFIFTFTGRMCTLLIIAKVLIYFGYSDVSESEYENMVFQLYNYMRTMNVPKEVQEVILDRMKYTYQKKYFNEQDILSSLTEQMKSELFLHGARNLIAICPPLQSLDKYELTKLFAHMKPQVFSPNEIIQDFEDAKPYVFFISTGMAAGYTTDGIQFLLLGEGDVMGYIRMSPKVTLLYSSLFISMETTEVYCIHYKHLKLVAEETPWHFLNYFRTVRYERCRMHRNCKSYHTKTNTVVTQLKKGELLEKPRLRQGYADLDL